MKTLFRLEDSSGKGVYQSGFFDDLIANADIANQSDQSPNPWNDNRLYANYGKHKKLQHLSIYSKPDVRFCFDSKEKLLRWFDRTFLRSAFKIGLKIVVLRNVSEDFTIEGESQDVMEAKAFAAHTDRQVLTSLEEFENFV